MTNDQDYMMYEFKGRLMKELSRKLKRIVTINIFYKEETDFVGILLSVPTDAENGNISKLYRVEDPWFKIQTNSNIRDICHSIVEDYKCVVLSKFFKDEGGENFETSYIKSPSDNWSRSYNGSSY